MVGKPLTEKEEKALKNKKKQTTDIVRKKVDKELKKGNMTVDKIANKAKTTLLEGKHPGKKFEPVPKPGKFSSVELKLFDRLSPVSKATRLRQWRNIILC